MSEERELLKKILNTGWLNHELSCEVEAILAQPEQEKEKEKEPVACNAIPNENSDTVSAFNPVSNNYWSR